MSPLRPFATSARCCSDSVSSVERVMTASNPRVVTSSNAFCEVECQIFFQQALRARGAKVVAAMARIENHPVHGERQDVGSDGLREHRFTRHWRKRNRTARRRAEDSAGPAQRGYPNWLGPSRQPDSRHHHDDGQCHPSCSPCPSCTRRSHRSQWLRQPAAHRVEDCLQRRPSSVCALRRSAVRMTSHAGARCATRSSRVGYRAVYRVGCCRDSGGTTRTEAGNAGWRTRNTACGRQGTAFNPDHRSAARGRTGKTPPDVPAGRQLGIWPLDRCAARAR